MSITALSNAGFTQLLQASNLSSFQQTTQTLARSLRSGNLSAAQTAFNQLQQLNGNQSKLGGKANAQLATDLATLGGALKAGSLALAKTAFNTVQRDLIGSNASAITTAANAASQIAAQIDTVIGVANGSSSYTSLFGASSSTPDIATQTTRLLSGVYGDHTATVRGSFDWNAGRTGTNVNVSA